GSEDPLIDTTERDPVASMARQMARRGFAPSIERDGDRAEIILHECAFASAALTDQPVVCALDLGMAQGFAEVVGGLGVEELVPTDPRQPACRLRCRTAALAGAASWPPSRPAPPVAPPASAGCGGPWPFRPSTAAGGSPSSR